MSARRLLVLLGASAVAGLALGWMSIPAAPVRALDPVVEIAAPPPVAPSPDQVAARDRLHRYSARATPAWTELGLELTAAGHHELAARTEDALGRLREARDQPAPDTAALAEAHRALHAELAAAETGQVSVLARIEGALVRLEGGPLPEAGPVRPPGQEPPPLEASPGP